MNARHGTCRPEFGTCILRTNQEADRDWRTRRGKRAILYCMTALIKCTALLAFLLHGALLYAGQEESSGKEDRGRTGGDFLTLGLLSSADSIKTSVNLEVGLVAFSGSRFQVQSYTSLSGGKVFDDKPDLYQLALMEKLTFGQRGGYDGGISASRYGFFFASFGFMSFDRSKDSKFLFSPPYFWEIGGGAGANIRLSQAVALVAEVGGGLHVTGDGKDGFVEKLQKAGFGRMSLGFRYHL